MTCWNGGIRATGELFAPEKTRWFLLSFFWDGTDWQYHTKKSLPGDIFLPDKNSDLYTVTREEPTSAFVFLGFDNPLSGGGSAAGVGISEAAHVFESQMVTAQCDKTSCLNAFNTSFIPSLSYKMAASQFTEDQWEKMISPAIRATLNAAGIVWNMAHAVVYGPAKYQGLESLLSSTDYPYHYPHHRSRVQFINGETI